MKKISKLLLLLVLAATATSCLKDDKYALDPSEGHNVVEFYNVTAPFSAYTAKYVQYIPKTFENVANDEFMIGVNWAGPEDFATQDITVTLAPAPEAAAEAGYVQLDPSLYTMPTTLTIKKGEKFALAPVTVKPSSFNGDLPNAIGVKIVSTSHGIVSGNVGTVIFSLPVKNPWDGVYHYKSAATQTLMPNWETEIELRTINATRVRMSPGLVGYYSNQVDLVVDRATNKVTVEMTTLLPIATDPSSHYDPATKTFHLKWTSGGGNRYFEETITYIGPRD
jgi:hypothetical protein